MSWQFVLSVPRCRPGHGADLTHPTLERVGTAASLFGECPWIWLGEDTLAHPCGDAGILIGEVFSRGSPLERGPGVLAHLPDSPRAAGKWLIRNCWGAYVAVLTEPGSAHLCLLTDPSGLFPIYRLPTATHTVVTSDVRLLKTLPRLDIRVCWTELANFLRWPELRHKATCLDGLGELVPGEMISLGHDVPGPIRLWSPRSFLPGGELPSRDMAARELRDLAIKVMKAWSRRLGPVAVAASGGVDSSLICAALAEAGEQFSCITLSTADPSGDERRFVHSLGAHLGVPVAARTYALSDVDLALSASSGLPRPQYKLFMQALDAALAKAAGEQHAEIILDGNGGDNLFCYLHSAAPVADCLRVRGLGTETLSAFLDTCQLTGASIPTMARGLLRKLARGSKRGRALADTRLLNPDFQGAGSVPLRNWLDVEVGRHGGKSDHLALLLGCQNHLRTLPLPGQPRRLSPLASQPLLEFCLELPTWYWSSGGINRSLARSAFGSVLPKAIVRRTSKSGPDSFIRAVFAERRHEISQLLLDGLLAAHGILERTAVETALQTSAHAANPIVYRLLDLVEAEAWARSWQR